MKNCAFRLLVATLFLNTVAAVISLGELFYRLESVAVKELLTNENPWLSPTRWFLCPFADFYFSYVLPVSAGAIFGFLLVIIFSDDTEPRAERVAAALFAVGTALGVIALSYMLFVLGSLTNGERALYVATAVFGLLFILFILFLPVWLFLYPLFVYLGPVIILGVLFVICFVLGYLAGSRSKRNLSLALLLTTSNHSGPDFFSRALFSPLASQYNQTYYSLTIYFFLAFALCGLLAGLAYLFSISTAQETEKRSEYECGFAPFDSATRLPFDVHFYLVGILFLIFDVEVALLFPWVLALRTTGWFGFYLMIAFLTILSLGFLYEWKRGALIWPTRYSKKNLFPLLAVLPYTPSSWSQELLDILSTWPALMVIGIFTLHHLALLYNWVRKSERYFTTKVLRVFWFIGAVIFLCSLYCSYYLSAALAVVFFVSSYTESNPFWPARGYWGAHIIITSLPVRGSKQPCMVLFRFWGAIFLFFVAYALFHAYQYYHYVPHKSKHHFVSALHEFFRTSILEMVNARIWKLLAGIAKTISAGFYTSAIVVFATPFRELNSLGYYIFAVMSPCDFFAVVLMFWMVASITFNYTYGHISFVFRGILYQKQYGDPTVFVTMAYLWKEVRLAGAFFLFSAAACAISWSTLPALVEILIITAPLDTVCAINDLATFIITAPGRIVTFILTTLHTITTRVETTIIFIWLAFKPLIPLVWQYKYWILWATCNARLYYYANYLHRQDVNSVKEVFIISMATIGYVFFYPFYQFYQFITGTYSRIRDTLTEWYTAYKEASTPETYTELSDSFADETDEKGEEPVKAKTPTSSLITVVVDVYGNPTGENYYLAFARMMEGSNRLKSSMHELAAAQIHYEDVTFLRGILCLTIVLLFVRSVQLTVRWCTRPPIPADTPPQIVKKYAWTPRKASIWGWLLSWVRKEEEVVLFMDRTEEIAELNNELVLEILAMKQGTAVIYNHVAALVIVCLCFLAYNLYLSRKCQQYFTTLDGILTDGALVVVAPEPEESVKTTKSLSLFIGTAGAAELLSPLTNGLVSTNVTDFPLLAEALLFLLICAVITKLSFDLGKEHNKRVLAYTSWRALSVGLFIIVFIYLYQFMFDTGSATVLGGYFATSRAITLLKLITLISAVFVLDASETFMRQHSRHLLEYPIMVALTTFFMLLLVSANHVMSTFLALVGFSLGLYVLILYDANRRPSREAGLKYYYLSTLSSGFILYGILLVYTLTGTGNFDELFLLFNARVHLQENNLLQIALLLILAGFFFKLSAFPGHLWAADVYEGSPAPVTAFFMLPVKIVVLGAFIRLFSIALAPLAGYWLPLLTLAVIISIVWGAFASVQEKKIRRFLAYASINQMGFLLMGLTTDSDEGYQAALLYIAVYAVMTCAFLTIFLSARRQDGSELLYVSDFRTLASRNWLVGWSLAIVLFSMAGIPPLGGFFAKYLVLLHAFEKGLMVEVIVGLATSLISTYYYLRIIKIIKFEQPDGAMPSAPCLTARRQSQLFIAEAMLWSFIVFAPAILSLTYTLALTHGPACLLF